MSKQLKKTTPLQLTLKLWHKISMVEKQQILSKFLWLTPFTFLGKKKYQTVCLIKKKTQFIGSVCP